VKAREALEVVAADTTTKDKLDRALALLTALVEEHEAVGAYRVSDADEVRVRAITAIVRTRALEQEP